MLQKRKWWWLTKFIAILVTVLPWKSLVNASQENILISLRLAVLTMVKFVTNSTTPSAFWHRPPPGGWSCRICIRPEQVIQPHYLQLADLAAELAVGPFRLIRDICLVGWLRAFLIRCAYIIVILRKKRCIMHCCGASFDNVFYL